MAKNFIQAITLAEFDSSTLSSDFQPMITGGLAKACFLLRITNACNKDITISFDGTNAADYIFTSTANNIPAFNASQPNSYTALWMQGQQVYVKGTAGTGKIYIAGYYLPQGI